MLPLASSDGRSSHSRLAGFLGDFTLVPDGLGVLIAVIATVVGSLAVIFSINYMQHHEEQLARYYALILFFIGAMAGLGLSGSLLFTFIFWEITAFCSYALISFHNDDPKAVAGGIKALIMTQLGGVGLLAGALLIYAYLGDYQINTFLAQAHSLAGRHPEPDGLWFPGGSCCQVSAGALAFLAAGCHGSTHTGDRPHPCRHDGQRRRLSAGPLLPGF